MEKREVESKKKRRDPYEKREIERVYCQKRSITTNVKLPAMENIASIMRRRKYMRSREVEEHP